MYGCTEYTLPRQTSGLGGREIGKNFKGLILTLT